MTENSPAAEPPLPLDWGHETAGVSSGGLDIKRTATEAERARLAAALEILGIETLQVNYRLKRAPADGYRLKGKLSADVVQACIVTLAPVLETVGVPFDVEFRPADDARLAEAGAVDLDDDMEIEPIDGTWLAVGRIVFEELAAGLNPYPRRPGAEFEAPKGADGEAANAKENPFAVLAKLKRAPPAND